MMESPADASGRDGTPIEVDGSVARPARVYDYVAGGNDNFAADREAAEHASSAGAGGLEHAQAVVRTEREFLARVVRYLVAEAGIRQFLDIGTGIPNAGSIHETAQQIAPDSRVVYVDDDAVVLAHAHTLRRSAPEGATAYIDGDLRDPASILREVPETLDLGRPVAVMFIGTLHHVLDEDEPYKIVNRFLEAVPSGSYLAVSHLTDDVLTEEITEAARRVNQHTGFRLVLRSRADIGRFFDGLEMIDPGLVAVDQWRPGPALSDGWENPYYGAVARKA